MDVSIIIVNYNTLHITQDCLNSIFEKTRGLSFEVILVDNASSDGSIEYFSQDKRITFLESGENLGFGKANNLGLTKAKGKYIFFLNSDTLLVNNAVREFFDYAESTSGKIGAIGCLLKDKSAKTIHSFSKYPSIIWPFKKVAVAHLYQLLFKKKYKLYDKTNADVSLPVFRVDYVTGADLFVKRKIIDEFGAFDPDFFMYYEETEMQHRWSNNGYLSYIIKMPQIIHLEGGSQNENRQFRADKFLMSFDSERLYFKKTNNLLKYLLFRINALIYILMLLKNRVTLNDFLKGVKCLLN